MNEDALAAADALLRSNDATGAVKLLEPVLADPQAPAGRRAIALRLRSRAREALRDIPAALADMQTVVALQPGDARAWNELGILSVDVGRPKDALKCFEQAVEIDPGYARAWNNLGIARRDAFDSEGAQTCFEKATAADPAYALAWANLGIALRDRGEEDAARVALERALALQPTQRIALSALGNLLRLRGELDAAAALYARATQAAPNDGEWPFLLGQTLADKDDLDGARDAYDRARARDPQLLRAALGRRLALPAIAADQQALHEARHRYAAGLGVLETELPERAESMSAARRHDEVRWTNFLLAYQGEDDLALQSRYGDLVTRVIGSPSEPGASPRGPDPLRVGFVSAYFRDCTAGRYFEHWITDLPRERFSVHLYVRNGYKDALTGRLAARAEATHGVANLPPSQLAPRIAADALDILIYPELGMDATTFAVAAKRLAPLQCAGWGHPVTSGLPSIDVFFSSAIMEPDDARAHYRERLVLLPGLGTRYALPHVPADASRNQFGLPDDAVLLLCPQSLFKIHPDNDALFARILAAVPQAQLVLFAGRHPALTKAYLARLDRAFAAEDIVRASRVQVIPRCGHDDYLRVNRVCDVMLDTLHWSGGNTSLDALACALPMVTLPGRFMRGRQSAGMLRAMGIGETIASGIDHYIGLATRLACDTTFRHAVRERITAARGALFDDARPTAEFAATLLELAQA
jgi:predicted O-linked N-acetylglucosamine transferase (SPINDLY family)